MSRLVTTSLVGSIDWLRNCPPFWKESAYKSLYGQLAREPWNPTIAIKKGIAFENDVYNFLGGKSTVDLSEVSEHFKFFLNNCKGGWFQNKNKEFVDIEDEEYCLYIKEDVYFKPGKHDSWPKGLIQDIKTSGKWGGRSKYLSTFQHKLYCHVEQIPDFQYLVAVWEDAESDSRKIASVHQVDYHVEDFAALKEEVMTKVKDTINFLQADDDLWALYLDKFCLY